MYATNDFLLIPVNLSVDMKPVSGEGLPLTAIPLLFLHTCLQIAMALHSLQTFLQIAIPLQFLRTYLQNAIVWYSLQTCCEDQEAETELGGKVKLKTWV